jgi:hypothetical protein
MNLSPTSSLGSTSSTASSPASNATLHPNHGLSPILRRRSVDTGGLSLAINDHEGSGSGRGYGGWVDHSEALPGSIDVAELVIAMRHQTHSIIDQAFPPTSPFFRPFETDAHRETYIRKLATWHFDASHAPPEELLACTTLLFELLWTIEGMEQDIGLAFGELTTPWIPFCILLVAWKMPLQTLFHHSLLAYPKSTASRPHTTTSNTHLTFSKRYIVT